MPLGGPDRHPLDQGIRGEAIGETAGIATRGSWAPKTACESGFERGADRSMFEMRASGLGLGRDVLWSSYVGVENGHQKMTRVEGGNCSAR